MSPTDLPSPRRSWQEILGPYQGPDRARSLWQLISTAVLFVATWGVMLWTTEIHYGLTLLLALFAAGLYTRLFIIQHDCGHGSFFRSRNASDVVGFLIGVLTLTPYRYWRKTHAIHHATHGDLGRRQLGDIETLSVREYLAMPWWKRLGYRLYRNPLVLMVVGPVYQFGIKHRLPFDAPLKWKREWGSVMATNLALFAMVLVAWRTIGLERFLMVHVPILWIAGGLGIWLFYVQHQFEDTYWAGHEEWSFHDAGLHGSSFYDLPRFLHWMTGNIGYHHVHHLDSHIPNYRLRSCHEDNPELQQVTSFGILESLRCARLKLWDEESRRMVGWRELRERARAAAAEATT